MHRNNCSQEKDLPTLPMPERNLGFAQNLRPDTQIPQELIPFVSQEQWKEILRLLLSAANTNGSTSSCLPFFHSRHGHQLPQELRRSRINLPLIDY
jgi:hypothetical protein